MVIGLWIDGGKDSGKTDRVGLHNGFCRRTTPQIFSSMDYKLLWRGFRDRQTRHGLAPALLHLKKIAEEPHGKARFLRWKCQRGKTVVWTQPYTAMSSAGPKGAAHDSGIQRTPKKEVMRQHFKVCTRNNGILMECSFYPSVIDDCWWQIYQNDLMSSAPAPTRSATGAVLIYTPGLNPQLPESEVSPVPEL